MTKQPGGKPERPAKSALLAGLGAIVFVLVLVVGVAWGREWLGEVGAALVFVVAFIGLGVYCFN